MIRRYQPGDLARLREITVVCFDGVSIDQNIEQRFGLFATHDWKDRKSKHIDEDAQANAEGIFVYEADGIVYGYVTTRIDEESKVGRIPNLALMPECRGEGIGKQLLQAAFDYFEEHGMVVARIETLEQNSVGKSFYVGSGFTEVARQIHYAMPLTDRQI